MKTGYSIIAAISLSLGVAGAAYADGHASAQAVAAVKARKGQMNLYAFNLGLLGGMAKGAIDYDADAAKAAAGNMVKLSTLDQARLWPPGSDTETLGDMTRALASAWDSDSKAVEHAVSLAKASAAMNAVAGDGLDALRGTIGAVGKSCGGCHDDYRQPE